jgi:hypothetical protein
VEDTAAILGGNAASVYNFDADALRPIADRIGPTPQDLDQGSPEVLAKWTDLAAAGRPWLTGKEAISLPIGD